MNNAPGQLTVDFREFASLKQDITDMKSLMARLVEAMSRITVIEERQHTMAQSTSKAIERMELITERQHAYELANAGNASALARVINVEAAFRELHIENERNKARFQTIVWTMRAIWTVLGAASFGGIVALSRVLAALPT